MLAMFPPIAQMATAIVAVLALFIGPRLSFNASRRLAVAQSRQVWLDALRADVADVIALHQQVTAARTKARLKGLPEPEAGEAMTRISKLILQIRFRLNTADRDQLALIDALSAYVCADELDGPGFSTEPVLAALDPISRKVWSDIKAGKI